MEGEDVEVKITKSVDNQYKQTEGIKGKARKAAKSLTLKRAKKSQSHGLNFELRR